MKIGHFKGGNLSSWSIDGLRPEMAMAQNQDQSDGKIGHMLYPNYPSLGARSLKNCENCQVKIDHM